MIRCPSCQHDVEPVPFVPGSKDPWASAPRMCPREQGVDLVALGAMAPPQREAPKRLERHVLAEVRRYLRKRGAGEWRNGVGSLDTDHGKIPMGLGPGTADVIACYRGRFVAVECKAPTGGRQTPLQKKHEAAVRKAGGMYVLARDVDDVRRALDWLDAVLKRREDELAALRAGACVGEAGVRFYQDRCVELEAELAAMREGL